MILADPDEATGHSAYGIKMLIPAMLDIIVSLLAHPRSLDCAFHYLNEMDRD